MNRITFSFILPLLVINIVQCKKYLVEVDDEKGGNSQENPALVEEGNDEYNEETIEDNATIESEGIHIPYI